ncbi:uncharacterized protein LOC128328740 [Hemicordylus capensis]|uniref:uncharacterized protein LOC128328740 n=1 Tax=Hemicordylus capensis TaxID=884348 RepID=UPI002302093A|nr:uncharacterized protein LOC128328740 [Hemicordylus capensis]
MRTGSVELSPLPPAMAFETIQRGRKKLISFLQAAPDLILDDMASQGFISEDDYNVLDELLEPKKKMRRLLVKIQRGGEQTCQHFLESIKTHFPDLPSDLWPLESAPPNQGEGDSHSNDANVLEKKEPENPDMDPSVTTESENLNNDPHCEQKLREVPELALDGGVSQLRENRASLAVLPSEPSLISSPDHPWNPNYAKVLEKEPENPVADPEDKGLSEMNGSGNLKGAPCFEQKGPETPEAVWEGMPDRREKAPVVTVSQNSKGTNAEVSRRNIITARRRRGQNKPNPQACRSSFVFPPRQDERAVQEPGPSLYFGRPSNMAPCQDNTSACWLAAREASPKEPTGQNGDGKGPVDVKTNHVSGHQEPGKEEEIADEIMLMKPGPSGQRSRKLTMEEVPEINSEVVKTIPPQKLEDPPQQMEKEIGLVQKAGEESNGERKAEADLCTPRVLNMGDVVGRCSLAESSREESPVFISMCNEALGFSQQHHVLFVYWDVVCGNVPQEICDGQTKICFPDGRKNSEPVPVAPVKLRGDIKSLCLLFSMLTKVYPAVLIGPKNISDAEYKLRLTLQVPGYKYHFVLKTKGGKSEEMLRFLNLLNINNSQLLVKNSQNITELVSKLQLMRRSSVNSNQKTVDVEEMANVSQESGIQVDENMENCSSGTLHAKEIVEEIKDDVSYKKEMLKHDWRNFAKEGGKLCRMKSQMDTPTEDEKPELGEKAISLCTKWNQCDLTNGLTKLINGIQYLHHYFLKCMGKVLCRVKRQLDAAAEKSQFRELSICLCKQIQCDLTNGMTKLIHGIQHLNHYFLKWTKHFFLKGGHYFLKWVKFILNYIARVNQLRLRRDYKEKCHTAGNDPQQLAQLDESISMCKLEQFCEKKYATVKEGDKAKYQRHLPEVANDLSLEGFPVELMDRDASNIPLQQIVDILTTLNEKLRGRSKMMVITLLGIQSTGRSTLLNTSFGPQFVVNRCAFGTLTTHLRVPEKLQQEIGCDSILEIDTKGSEAVELAKVEDSCEHNSELSTLMTGLNDTTILNVAMENATKMMDILQTVVHAFRRMKKTGHKPNCQFVHPNASDVPASEQNMRDGKCLLEQRVKVCQDSHPEETHPEEEEQPPSARTSDPDVSPPDLSELEPVTCLEEPWSTANLVLSSKAPGPALEPPSPPTSPQARRRQRARVELWQRRQSSRLAAWGLPQEEEEEGGMASSGASKIRLLCKPRAEYLFTVSGFKTPFY